MLAKEFRQHGVQFQKRCSTTGRKRKRALKPANSISNASSCSSKRAAQRTAFALERKLRFRPDQELIAQCAEPQMCSGCCACACAASNGKPRATSSSSFRKWAKDQPQKRTAHQLQELVGSGYTRCVLRYLEAPWYETLILELKFSSDNGFEPEKSSLWSLASLKREPTESATTHLSSTRTKEVA